MSTIDQQNKRKITLILTKCSPGFIFPLCRIQKLRVSLKPLSVKIQYDVYIIHVRY